MIPAIAPDQTRRCALCGVYQSVLPGHEEHHMIPRSLGGTETITLCVKCHNATEGDTAWKVGVTDDYVFALDNAGKIIVKRWFAPEGFNEGLLLQQLEAAPERLKDASAQFRFLTDDALESAANAIKDIMGASWYCMGYLFREAVYRTPWGDKKERLLAFAEKFDLGKSQAYKYLAALDVAEEQDLVHKLDYWSPDALLVLKDAREPEKLIERYETMGQAGSYTLASFKADVKRDAAPLDPPPEYCEHRDCPVCGKKLIPHLKETS